MLDPSQFNKRTQQCSTTTPNRFSRPGQEQRLRGAQAADSAGLCPPQPLLLDGALQGEPRRVGFVAAGAACPAEVGLQSTPQRAAEVVLASGRVLCATHGSGEALGEGMSRGSG